MHEHKSNTQPAQEREAAAEEAISDLEAQSSRSQQHTSKLNEKVSDRGDRCRPF